MRLEIGLFIVLGVLCQIVGTIVLSLQNPPLDSKPLTMAVIACFLTSIPPIVVRHTTFARKNPAAMPLATVGWRMGVLFIALALSAATKWPIHILFCQTLLGCYFPFLVLESALSIRRIRLESRPQG